MAKKSTKYALHLAGWDYETGDKSTLTSKGGKVLASEYQPMMKGKLFCPLCSTNLSRVPESKNITFDKKLPYFSHQRKYDQVPCVWRIKKSAKQYATYEEMKRAIENRNLIVINDFLESPPVAQSKSTGTYTSTSIEEIDGPVVGLSLGRHTGDEYDVPSRITTVRAITRNFDRNLKRYFVMPGTQQAIRLDGLLYDIADVTETDEIPKLYYGKILTSSALGSSDSNIRMTRLVCHPDIVDFYFKAMAGISRDRGVGDGSTGRYILMYGKITENGIGLSISNPKWGSFDLLPEQYNYLLES